MTRELDQRLARHARERPDVAALEWLDRADPARPPQAMTYAHLEAMVDRAARRFRQRFAPGDVLLLRGANEPAFVVAFLALLRADLLAFPVGEQVSPSEVRTSAARTNPKAIIGHAPDRGLLDGGIPWIDIDGLLQGSIQPIANDPSPASPTREARGQAGSTQASAAVLSGLLLQSSGTTGLPKIVCRDRDSLDAVARAVCDAIGLRDDDRVLGVVQLTHSFGMENALLAPLWAGATIHLLRGADAWDMASVIRERSISVLPAVPFLFELLAPMDAPPGSAPDLRVAYSAGSPLPRRVFDRFATAWGARIGQLYGATEIGSVTFNKSATIGHDPASVGLPMSGVSLLILDPDRPDPARPLPAGQSGQVAVRAASMFRGYFDAPTDEVVDGHFLTGDLGRIDPGGGLTLTGRLKFLIDVGGLKVNPQEVEQALLEHPGIRECVVVPLPLTQTVERLKAIVVPRDARGVLDVEELRRFASERLSAYKVPRVIETASSLPRSPTGKILRQKLV